VNEPSFAYLDQVYALKIKLKRQKRIIFRMSHHAILISAPKRTSLAFIYKQLENVMPRLIQFPLKPIPITESGMYYLGHFYDFNTLPIQLNAHFLQAPSVKQYHILKTHLMEILMPRIEYYKKQMNIVAYLPVRIRTMKGRFGSHGKPHHQLTFASHLIHYDLAMIDAVIVHELTHYFHFNHSKDFYNTLFSYYPNYQDIHDKIKQGLYQ
jgi:predicted metal-dependent hydrolase